METPFGNGNVTWIRLGYWDTSRFRLRGDIARQATSSGVHTLRHSAAVAWLEAGVHIKAVADLLGHSSIAITGDIYGHASDATTRAAIDGLSGALGL
jgi:integrase